MTIDSFLMESLIDLYDFELEINNECLENTFEGWHLNDDGSIMSDEEFFFSNYSEILHESILEELHLLIIDDGMEKDFSLKQFVNFFASKYFVYNYGNGNNSVINFFKNSSIDEIEDLFVENITFGIEMIKSYFFSLLDEKRYINNRKKIYANNDEDTLINFEVGSYNKNEVSTNYKLRKHIYDIYNYYISNGFDDISALDYTWNFFFIGLDPIGYTEKINMEYYEVISYKQKLLCLIYSDVYEDICNNSIIISDNYLDRMALVVAIMSVNTGFINIPEKDIRNRILKHFILLRDDIEKRKENRKKTYTDERVLQLKKVNPSYLTDELTF